MAIFPTLIFKTPDLDLVPSPVHELAWSPDGKTLAAASENNSLFLWEGSTGELQQSLKEHQAAVLTLDWHPEGKWLASGSRDGVIKIWDCKTRKCLLSLPGNDIINILRWSPDGNLLAAASEYGEIQVWEFEQTPDSLSLLLSWFSDEDKDSIQALAWSPTGKQLAWGDEDNSKAWDQKVKIWKTDSWEVLSEIPAQNGQLGGLATHPNKPLLATLAEDDSQNLALWPLSPQEEQKKENSPVGFPFLSLRKLEIRNLRCLKNLKFSFEKEDGQERKWTLLLGKNGCGKTTLLRSVALLLSGTNGFLELFKKPDFWICIGENLGEILGELSTPEGEIISLHLQFQRGQSAAKVLQANQKSLEKIDQYLKQSQRETLVYGYGCSRRLSRSRSIGNEANLYETASAQSVATLFSPDAQLDPLHTIAMTLDYKKPEETYSVLSKSLNALLQGMEFLRIDKELEDLVFQTSDGEVPLSQLSDGYQVMVAWFGDLIYRILQAQPDLEDPLTVQGILLIDEIDLHLHPVWQRQLRRFLDQKLPNFQILATSHSVLTAQQAEQGELFTLTRSNPDLPPKLQAYHGVPKYLMVQQLLISSAFGVPTVHEEEVEALRNRYQELKDQSSRTALEKDEFLEIQRKLDGMYPQEQEREAQNQKMNTALDQLLDFLEEKKQ